uniref:Uncharacterized protein n=1 Tax=Globodera rostochiensis TaxID=31243 RepID=A0A914HSU9_GLORO
MDRHFPPIPLVLAKTGQLLNVRGLNHIADAFKKAVEENMICRCCRKKIEFIAELCICPDSNRKCHHATGCCNAR